MTASKHEQVTRADYAERYRVRASATVVDEAEREVIGDVWGANGFTTVDQAQDLRRRLQLDTNSRLLDVGSGCGWPGLWLAQQTGCEVVVTDLPLEGLAVATGRAKAEELRSLGAVAASARRFPFAESSFDAIVHVDLIC
jgi:methylase of polypeptide subunit release factors